MNGTFRPGGVVVIEDEDVAEDELEDEDVVVELEELEEIVPVEELTELLMLEELDIVELELIMDEVDDCDESDELFVVCEGIEFAVPGEQLTTNINMIGSK